MENIAELTKTALNTGLSSYYRKDALRQLARLKKSAELTEAVLKLLKDMENDSLQREVMDLAVTFTISEAVNLIIPLAVSDGINARFAINILAKLGGKKAYNALSDISKVTGFSLTKSTAARGLQDILRNTPELEEKEQSSSVKPDKKDTKEILNRAIETPQKKEATLVDSLLSKAENTIVNVNSSVNTLIEKVSDDAKSQDKLAEKSNELKRVQKLLLETENKILLIEKEHLITQERLEKSDSHRKDLKQQLKQVQVVKPNTNEEQRLREENHKFRNSIGRITATYEKKIANLEEKITDLEDDITHEKTRRRKLSEQVKAKGSKGSGGCIFFIICVILLFIVSKSCNSEQSKFEHFEQKINAPSNW